MIDQTIRDIEAQIHDAKHLSFHQRKELQILVADLKEEVLRLSQTHQEDAESIALDASLTTGEGLKHPRNPQQVQKAVDRVRASVARFEKSHPRLTMVVNSISTFFSNIGI